MSDPKGNDGDGIAALSYILAGLLLYGGLGWLGDHWLGTGFLLPAGLILGLGLGVFLVIRRYGAHT
jgi:F0F1-type ATP synthase assembly protein I